MYTALPCLSGSWRSTITRCTSGGRLRYWAFGPFKELVGHSDLVHTTRRR